MYKWQFTTDEENSEGYYQKLVNMNLPEVLSLEEAAERLNELEHEAKEYKEIFKKALNAYNHIGASAAAGVLREAEKLIKETKDEDKSE